MVLHADFLDLYGNSFEHSLNTMAKRKSILIGVLILLLASIICLCWSTVRHGEASLERSTALFSADDSACADDLASVARSRDSAPVTRRSAAESSPIEVEDAPASGKFEFDVTFIAVDDQGLTVPFAPVSLCLLDHPPNEMGRCDENGKLHLSWRGEEPAIDGFVGLTGRSTNWSRVRILAGSPWSVHFFGDSEPAPPVIDSVPIVEMARRESVDESRPSGAMQPQVLGANGPSVFDRVAADKVFTRHFHMPESLSFRVDSRGNGVFADAGLLTRLRTEPTKGLGRPSPFSSRKLGGQASSRPAMTRAEFSVHDPEGRALPGISVRTYQAGRNSGMGRRTDANGKYSVTDRVGSSVDIEFGGGIFAVQRRTYLLARVPEQSFDIVLSQLPLVRGRLMDEDGKALAGWRVQVREDQPPFGFLQSCTTDGNGNFAGGIEHGSFARLLASPPDGGGCPAMSIAEHIAAGLDPVVVTIHDAARRTNAGWTVAVPRKLIGGTPIARVERDDSGESVLLVPSESDDPFGSTVAETFRFEGALLGDYALASFALGGCSDLPMRLDDADRDIGIIPTGGCMQVVLMSDEKSDADPWTACLVTRSRGFEVRSRPVSETGTYFVLAGEARLQIETLTTGRSVQREIRGQAGDRFEVRLTDLIDTTVAIPPKAQTR